MIHLLDAAAFAASWLYAALFYYILGAFLPLRGNRPVRVLAFFVSSLFSQMVVFANDYYNLIGALFCFALYILVFCRGNWAAKLAALLVFYPAVTAVNYLVQDIGGRLFFALTAAPPEPPLGWTPQLYLISTAFETTAMLVRLLFWVGAWFMLRRYLRRITEILTMRMWLIVDAIMLVSFVAVLMSLCFIPETPAIIYPTCAACIVSSFGCIYLAAYICTAMQTEHRARVLEMQQAFYKDRMAEEEKVRRIYHDMKNHLLILQGCGGGSRETETAIRSLQGQIEAYENYQHTGNDFLDLILRDKARLAKEKHIDLSVTVRFGDGGFLEPLDISTIFGNALDNAIEASEQLPEELRLITVKASRIRDMLAVTVENNCRLDTLFDGKTTKKESSLHGFGISNIQKAAEKYGGQCVVKPGEGKFVLKVILPVPGYQRNA